MALSTNTPRTYGDFYSDRASVPVKATSVIYEGSAVGMTAGYARALTAGDLFVGFADEAKTGGATDGLVNVSVKARGYIQVTITSVAVTDIGKPVYASDDGTLTLTQGSNSRIGRLHRYVTTDTAIVDFEAASTTENKVYSVISIPIVLATIAADTVTDYIPGFAGTIEAVNFVTTTAASTVSKQATLNLEIGSTNITGGTVPLTTVSCNTLGKLTAGSAVTAANVFSASDTISVEATSITAFVEGSGVLLITVSCSV